MHQHCTRPEATLSLRPQYLPGKAPIIPHFAHRVQSKDSLFSGACSFQSIGSVPSFGKILLAKSAMAPGKIRVYALMGLDARICTCKARNASETSP
jgi:hypothetical protein